MMQALTVEQLQQALIQASQVIIANEPLLTQIDSIIGDGDHGTGMRDGFSVLQEKGQCSASALDEERFYAFF